MTQNARKTAKVTSLQWLLHGQMSTNFTETNYEYTAFFKLFHVVIMIF
jgi:hypothetical protein